MRISFANPRPLISVSIVMLAVLTCVAMLIVLRPSQTMPLPGRKVFSANRPPTMDQCAICHSDVCEAFETAPHRLTLTRAASPDVLEHFAGKSFSFENDGPLVRYENRNEELWLVSTTFPDSLRVDWIFGSGQHAQTPVSVLKNPDGRTESFQHRVSWYPTNTLGVTPGLEASPDMHEGLLQLVQPEDHVITMDCFECHVTHLPHNDGLINEAHIIAGVGCDRCHPGGHNHMASVEDGAISMERWSELSPLESVNRCGECHRRADQLTESELNPDRPVLTRFASVGLTMSACFQQQSAVKVDQPDLNRLDCVTCHDPHRPAVKDSAFYVRKCNNCHGGDDGMAAECASQPMSSNCLPCYLPKQRMTDDLAFTDHWIRVRK